MDYQAIIIGFGFVTVIGYKRTLRKEVIETKENIFQKIETIIFQILNIEKSHPKRNNFIDEFKYKINENGLMLKFIDKSLLRKQRSLNIIFVLLVFTLLGYIMFTSPLCSDLLFCETLKIYFNIYVFSLIIVIAFYTYAIFNKLDFLLR